MILAEYLPQSNMIEAFDTMVRTVITDELTKLPIESSEPTPIKEEFSSITSIKIPLVSFQPILATSPNYILTNEVTKKRKQLVVFDDHLERYNIRLPIAEPILNILWNDIQQHFLILTETNIFAFDPNTRSIRLINELIPENKKIFKCFELLDEHTLIIAHDEWGAEYIYKWQLNNENGLWNCTDKQSIRLTMNEFIGDLKIVMNNDSKYLTMTIYNKLIQQWRLEIRNMDTLTCEKSILLSGCKEEQDYKVLCIKNAQSDIRLLVFSRTKSKIIAIDSKWEAIQRDYQYPVQEMAVFGENYLVVRTTQRVDIHLFE